MSSSEEPALSDGSKQYGERERFDPEFSGPVKSRSCTDVLCLFLFISFLAGWCVVAFFAMREGNPAILFFPTDSDGNLCGIGTLENEEFLYFFDLRKCADPKVVLNGCPTPQVCVKKCPSKTFMATMAATTGGMNETELKKNLICKLDTEKDKKSVAELINEGLCADLYLESTPLLNRCVPKMFFSEKSDVNASVKKIDAMGMSMGNLKIATGYLTQFLSLTELGNKVFSDLLLSWPFMLKGLGGALGLSFLWILLMRWLTGLMVWSSIFLAHGLLIFVCYVCTMKYIDLKNVPGSTGEFKLTLNVQSYLALRNTWLGFAIVTGVLLLVLLLICLFLRKRILIAIALIKETGRAVVNMTCILFYPIVTFVIVAFFFGYWVTVTMNIASSGKASYVIADAPDGGVHKNGENCNPKRFLVNRTDGLKCIFQTYGLKDNLYSSHAYNLFGFLWTVFFALGVGYVSMAGAFSKYYWTQDKLEVATCCGSGTLLVGLYRCCRYHLGSVAFGSLLIAFIRFIRVMLEFLDKKLKKYDNAVTRTILWITKCCCWCLEKILRYISRNAYIMIAVYGQNFCSSAKRAFGLLMRNILRAVVLDSVTDFLLLMGKLVVVGAVGSASFYVAAHTDYYEGPPLNFNLLPPCVITFGAYIIASGFFSVYAMAVDTLFLCFLEDCERNDGSVEKPYYMSKELMKILHTKNTYKDLVPSK